MCNLRFRRSNATIAVHTASAQSGRQLTAKEKDFTRSETGVTCGSARRRADRCLSSRCGTCLHHYADVRTRRHALPDHAAREVSALALPYRTPAAARDPDSSSTSGGGDHPTRAALDQFVAACDCATSRRVAVGRRDPVFSER